MLARLTINAAAKANVGEFYRLYVPTLQARAERRALGTGCEAHA